VIPGTKAILGMLGVECGIARAPFRPLTAIETARLEACCAEHLPAFRRR
jgi:hypothetical protein